MTILENVSLKPYNTFGIEVYASYFVTVSDVSDLNRIFQDTRWKSVPKLILGGGSNVLLTRNFEGLVIKNELKGLSVESEDENYALVKASSGEIWHEFVLFTLTKNLGGIENLSLIPGSVGAAPMQNIGAYGVEIKDVFYELEAYEIAGGNIRKFNLEECSFGYRESVFKRALKDQYFILNMTLRLSKNVAVNTSYGAINEELQKKGISQPGIRDVSDAVIAIRRSKLPNPAEIGNSGSFFKNPVVPVSTLQHLKEQFADIPSYPVDENHAKLAAGWLIERAGWKGKTLGNYGVHKLQALVLVNYGGATGKEIYDLSEEIVNSVHQKFGVTLEREVNIL